MLDFWETAERRNVMTDQLTKALEELKEKSAFVCNSCGYPTEITKLQEPESKVTKLDFHDRFTDAAKEEEEKSAFVCKSCGHHEIIRTKKLH